MAVRTLQLEDIGDVVDRACIAFLRLQALRRALQEELDHDTVVAIAGLAEDLAFHEMDALQQWWEGLMVEREKR